MSAHRIRVAGVLAGSLLMVACASSEPKTVITVLAVTPTNPVEVTFAPATVAGGDAGTPITGGAGQATTPPTAPPATSTTTTTPTGPQVVTITQGEFNTKASGSCGIGMCKYVDIQSSGWERGETLQVTCHSNVGSSGPYTKTADSAGNLHSTTACFFGNVNDVYVDINGVQSNVVSPWKNW